MDDEEPVTPQGDDIRADEARLLARAGSWSWELRDDLVTWSPALERAYRLDPELVDPKASGFLKHIHPDDRPQVIEGLEAAVNHAAPVSLEYRVVNLDGTANVIHTIGHVETDTDGKPVRMAGTWQDVTEQRAAQVELRASEERYRSLVELSPDAIVVAGAGRLFYANPAACALLGAQDANEIVGRDIREFIHPDSMERSRERARIIERGEPAELTEQTILRVDGTPVVVEAASGPIIWRGEPAVQTVVRDVSGRKEAELFVDGHTRVLELVTQGAPLGETLAAITFLVESLGPDTKCSIMLMEDGVLRVAAGPSLPQEFLAAIDETPIEDGVGCCGTAAARVSMVVVQDAAADPLTASFRDLAAQFGIRSCWSVPVVDSASGEVMATFAVYTTEQRTPTEDELRLLERVTHLAEIAIARKRSEEELAHQALHDLMTGLPNRALLLDRLDHALARAGRSEELVAVLFLDLDHFKILNDSRGHAAGDELLQAVAGRLRDVIRPSDTIARFGGDEFVVVCEGVADELEARLMGERIAKAVGTPFPLSAGDVYIGVSVGISLATGNDDADTALRNADAAMYRAKERGRARVEVFDEKLRVRSRVRYETETSLRRAVERGELVLAYQPVVAVPDGRMIGAEALVRWEHPEQGEILPDAFIPLAEEAGLIMPIGAWVLEEACAQTARWLAAHPEASGFGISVNLSARQLLLPDLVDQVVDVLGRTRLDASHLTLEITETVLMEDVDFSIERLHGIRELGVRLAVDDFGTGYSSLSYLKRLPVDTLKIDRSFVDGLGTDQHDSSIVAAVVALAEALDLVSLAEGVETRLQVAELRSLGCRFAQGFHYARPVRADAIDPLFGHTLPIPAPLTGP